MTAVALLVACNSSLVACGHDSGVQSRIWRTDCPPTPSFSPLSVEAARDAYKRAARRHELRAREAATPGFFLHALYAALDEKRIAAGEICLSELSDLGALLFEHEYGFADGLGSGRAASDPAGPFHRVHRGLFGGPETLSCVSCHWVGGRGGGGAETDNALLEGDGERVASGDARNPPALVGLGVVQALAREMSDELRAERDDLLREAARAGAAREAHLTAKGVDFGLLRVDAAGAVDASGVRGVDADLIVKPFGWKGTLATFAQFATEALQVHIGIQNDVLLANAPKELLGDGSDRDDPDADGMRRELPRGPFEALTAHLALTELPVIEPLIQSLKLPPPAAGLAAPTTTSFADDFQRGREQFHALGCVGCHVPMMVLKDPVLELDGMPPIDLAEQMPKPALTFDESLQGYPVWLFSDLKRHDMGPANAASHVQNGVALEEYLTPRLWGVADSAPYLHDGRAPSFDYAIAGHDGEGAAARAAYAAVSDSDRSALRVYLMSLRRAPRVMIP